ncbi:MAG: hypothetical protein FJ276_26775 [Planctomycetes bacterium]|nr:hypothetical protein [Planctomycetota bacterium]
MERERGARETRAHIRTLDFEPGGAACDVAFETATLGRFKHRRCGFDECREQHIGERS